MKWISIEVALPAYGRKVIVIDEDNEVYICYYKGGSFKNDEYIHKFILNTCGCCGDIVNKPTYWMPLPIQPERLSEKTSKDEAIV